MKIKRIKIEESLEEYNFKNNKKGVLTQEGLGTLVGSCNVTLSRWNTGNVPKALNCLFQLSEDLEIPIKKLFHYVAIKDQKKLVSIKVHWALSEWNKNNVGNKNLIYLSENLDFSRYKLYCWENGKPKEIPKTLSIFFNVCNILKVDPNKILVIDE